ncbi:hypothetical protein [Streptomyces sp. NPDC047108]|uniref:hypothetical protein n=1 Tax=Streptomyces sp. NPDC047108 TaxID=3155025 RepID=UPI0033C65DD4
MSKEVAWSMALTASVSTVLAVVAPAAHAGPIGNGSGSSNRADSTRGNSNGSGSLEAAAATRVKVSTPNGKARGGNLDPIDTDWTPPVCWYEPAMTPKEFKGNLKDLEKRGRGMALTAIHSYWDMRTVKRQYGSDENAFGDGTESSKNYNLAKQGEGMWWRGVVNPNRQNEYDNVKRPCGKNVFWVDHGEVAAPESISPKVLAEYAYDSIKVPDTEIEMSPEGKSTVNLPTWMWLDGAKFKPVEVTASIGMGGGQELFAITEAEPVSLHLDPGTEDAQVHPASGECPIRNGKIGTPYTKGDSEKSPPCGITYLRASSDSGPYELKASVTWKISWKGSGGTGGDLPDGTFETTEDVTVQEAQAVNR